LFDYLRDLAISQGALAPGGLTTDGQSSLTYWFEGINVCRDAFARLYGIGLEPRFKTVYNAVMSGKRSCPIDVRFLTRGIGLTPSPLRGEVWSYLQTLFESVAETLPEDDVECKPFKSTDDIHIAETEEQGTVAIEQGVPPESNAERRFLPPGSVFDTWRQFCATDGKCGFKLFMDVWRNDFKNLLFRDQHRHTVCPVCTKHKLLIQLFAHDIRARLKQRLLYDRHLRSQYMDRREYWDIRSQARLLTRTITIILDGMDQAKFAWPRASFLSSHEYDGFQRPRLHITGILVHGVMAMLTISHADVSKSSSTTVDTLAYIFTRLHKMGLNLREYHVHVQMDNAASTNKNNAVLMFLAAMVCSGLIGTAAAGFLRVGHTHDSLPTMDSYVFLWIPMYSYGFLWFLVDFYLFGGFGAMF
jgi:hypothetical protein